MEAGEFNEESYHGQGVDQNFAEEITLTHMEKVHVLTHYVSGGHITNGIGSGS